MGKELFTEEFKMMVVQYVLDGHTRRETSEKFGVSCTPIEKWVNLYKLHGAEGLLSRNLVGRQKGFDSEFRLKVLQYKQEHNLSCTQTAMHFCLDVVTVCRWDKKFREKGMQGLMMNQKAATPTKKQKVREQAELKKENNWRYGYRRILMELRNRGYVLNHKTVQKLMKELGLKCIVRMKKYRSYRGEVGKTAPNLLNRDFHTEKPNQKWATDVTEFSLFGRKLYLSPILDMYNGEIISYAINERANFEQITEMLDKAFEKLPDDTGLILHSDQGWQYQNIRYQKRLSDKGIRQSMSRKGNCLDNAVMENFFGLLKSELLYLRDFCSFEEFQTELELYLEYYNYNRIKARLGGLSPVQYRIKAGFAV